MSRDLEITCYMHAHRHEKSLHSFYRHQQEKVKPVLHCLISTKHDVIRVTKTNSALTFESNLWSSFYSKIYWFKHESRHVNNRCAWCDAIKQDTRWTNLFKKIEDGFTVYKMILLPFRVYNYTHIRHYSHIDIHAQYLSSIRGMIKVQDIILI